MEKTKRPASADETGEVVLYEADDTTCTVCYAEFLDPDDLKLHVQQLHPSGKLINCQFCEKILSDAETYMLHIRDVHLLEFKSCSVCGRIFTHSSQMRRHEVKHPRSTPEGSFCCSQCSQYFVHESELRQHELENHYETDEGAFLNKYYSLLSSVINIKADLFLKTTENADRKFIYSCVACKYRNADLEAYIMHLREKNCRSLACDRCCKVYKHKPGIIIHARHCNTVRVKSLKIVTHKQCKTCKKYFDHESMKDHVLTPCLKCANCDSVFRSMYELSEHQPKAHPLAVMLTVCQFCRKECVGTVSLEKHIQRSHEHEFHLYKYTCLYCDTTFKHPQRLFAHYFLKHKDIDPYLCKICDKKFRIRKVFTLHIKLQHKSEGFVEFDERLHVFFTNKKSEKPFQPVSLFVKEKPTADENKAKDGSIESEMEKGQELQLANMESDVNQTETECNQNDSTKAVRSTRKRKKQDVVMELSDYDSDDEPLVVTKKKAKLKSQLRKKPLQWKKKSKKSSKRQFTCEICKKYCYTFQNYQNHVNMHFRDESKRCIKCSLAFKTKVELERHMTEEHSSSQLTETLKNILERRKKGEQKKDISAKTKFLNTIKKVEIEKDIVTATLRPISKELSVQKFIEEFTPEEVRNVQVNNTVSLTKVVDTVKRQPVIKLTKFKPAPEFHESLIKLSMPVKFKKCNEVHSISVKKVRSAPTPSSIKVYNSYDGDQFQDDDYSYEEENKHSTIPEVEQEVTLEGTDEAPKRNPATHKIVIPKLPKELKSIRIAHLLPEAPYYKIVKMDDIMKQQEKQPVRNAHVKTPAEVRLPDGTKLVHVNPLAHLLGGTPVEQIVKTSKYYKPTTKNIEELLANALKKLENPNRRSRKKGETIIRREIELPEKSDNVEEENDVTEKTELRNDATEETALRNDDTESTEDTELRNNATEETELRKDATESTEDTELRNNATEETELRNNATESTEDTELRNDAPEKELELSNDARINDKESTEVFKEAVNNNDDNEEM